MEVGEQLQVKGVALVASGLCLSRDANGEILFVDGLLPEETALIEITQKKRGTKFASTIEIQTISEFRTTPPCKYVEKGCGGCDWQHIDATKQSEYKRDIVVDSLKRVGKLSNADEFVLPAVQMPKERYRTSAVITTNNSKWGFKARNTHEMVSIEDCLVMHHECVQQARDYVSLNEPGDNEIDIRRSPDAFLGQKLAVSPDSFYQSHIDAPEVLANLVMENLPKDKDELFCIDLYSGVGIFSYALAKLGHKVIAVEGNADAVNDANKNLYDFDAEVVKSDVRHYFYEGKQDVDLLIADPSREGIGKSAIKNVLSCKAKTIFLISCDPASGARDISMLIENGYKLESVTPIDMFAHTHHVEMFSVLSR